MTTSRRKLTGPSVLYSVGPYLREEGRQRKGKQDEKEETKGSAPLFCLSSASSFCSSPKMKLQHLSPLDGGPPRWRNEKRAREQVKEERRDLQNRNPQDHTHPSSLVFVQHRKLSFSLGHSVELERLGF